MNRLIRRSSFFKKAILWVAFFFLLFCSTEKKESVARVNGEEISIAYFKEHYTFNPLLSEIKNDSLAKTMTLHGLICRKVIAQDAARLADAQQKRLEQYVREAMIEQVWSDEILPRVSVSPAEVDSAFLRAGQQRVVRSVFFEDTVQARAFLQNPNWYRMDVRADTVDYDAQRALSDTLFSKNIGELAGPVMYNGGALVFQVLEETKAMDTSSETRSSTAKKLRLKKAKQQFRQFEQTTLSSYRYTVNREALKQLYESLSAPLQQNNLSALEIPPEYARNMIIAFGPHKNWNGDSLLQRLRVAPYPLKGESTAQQQFAFLQAVKNILDDEAMAMYARARGYASHPAVLLQKQMWRDFVLEQAWIEQHSAPEKALDSLLGQADIEINATVLDSLQLKRTNMTVLKQHFPARSLAPPPRPVLRAELDITNN